MGVLQLRWAQNRPEGWTGQRRPPAQPEAPAREQAQHRLQGARRTASGTSFSKDGFNVSELLGKYDEMVSVYNGLKDSEKAQITGFDQLEAAVAQMKDYDSAAQEAAAAYARCLGLAFQIRDDMLDVIGDEATFGKPIGSDEENEKSTFVSLLGLKECQKTVEALTKQAEEHLAPYQGREFLCALAGSLAVRNK